MSERTLSLIDQEIAGTISEADRDELFEQMMMDPAIGEELERREKLLHQRLAEDAALESRSRPWLISNAASVAVGAVGAWLVGTMLQVETPGIASANVYQIDNVRSTAALPPPVYVKADDPWVAFLAYPFEGVEMEAGSRVDARIDVFDGERETVRSAPESQWRNVWQQASSAGSRDTLLLTVPSGLLQPGLHRLAVHSVDGAKTSDKPIHEVIFDLQYDTQ